MKTLIFALILTVIAFTSTAQNTNWLKQDSLYKFVQPTASLQFWSVYTMGEKVKLTEDTPMEPVQDRVNFMVRRARFGFKGKPYPRLSYTLSVQYDNLGKDKLGAIRGGTNTGQLGILDAYFSYRLSKDDLIWVTAGYVHPQFSRECITGDMNVNSFDKSPAQGYIRQHINGKSYGRSTGLNLGGMKEYEGFSIGYNVGIFNNNTTGSNGVQESTGKFWSPVLVQRVTVSIGDPDTKKYAINYDVNNFFNERKGVTFGLNNSYQGRTDVFSNNRALGLDVMLNYGHLNLDVERVLMDRAVEGNDLKSSTLQGKLGYNLVIMQKLFLEPTFMYSAYAGDEGLANSGEEEMYDVGVNWYVNKKNFKLSLHYVFQDGHGDNGYTDGATFQKGDFVGAGMVLLL